MTHTEALDLDHLPDHLIVIGAGYVGLEISQALRRFGARVTVLERGEQLAGREDADVGTALLELFQSEGIDVFLKTNVLSVEGKEFVDLHKSIAVQFDPSLLESDTCGVRSPAGGD